MSLKPIEAIIEPKKPHFVGDGFRVHNFIPSAHPLSMERMNPFIMLDYNAPHVFPPSDKPRGVGVHPHKGFETVSIAYQGKIAHHDSAGNSGVIGEGDVQWMTAGSGILHKEYHEAEFSKKGGLFHMAQLWVNLPAASKKSPPEYQEISKKEMSRHILPNNMGQIEIIAGNHRETQGKAKTHSPMHVYNAHLHAGGKEFFSFPVHFNTALLVVKGLIMINKSNNIPSHHFVLFKNEGMDIEIEALEESIVLMLSGQPIHEPIAAHGPFVMNTRHELVEAFQEFQAGKFGVLED